VKRRLLNFFAVLSLGIGGCIPVPTWERFDDKPAIPSLIGDAHSTRPIRPGVQEHFVTDLLGKPTLRDSGGWTLQYGRIGSCGMWLMPGAGSGAAIQQRIYRLRVKIGDDGLIDCLELWRGSWEGTNFGFEEMSDDNRYILDQCRELVFRACR
jgi:hypothetical protein